jgi:hypothetical protein
MKSILTSILMTLSGTALLQASEHASFHLASATHWGATVLPPGDYRMTLPNEGIGERQMKIEGQGKTVYVFPMVADPKAPSDSSHLELKQVNGQAYVKGLYSGLSGREYLFHTPKSTQLERVEGM